MLQYVCLYIYGAIHLSIYICCNVSVYIYMDQYIYLYIYVAMYLPIYIWSNLSVYIYIEQYIFLYIYGATHLSVHVWSNISVYIYMEQYIYQDNKAPYMTDMYGAIYMSSFPSETSPERFSRGIEN